MHLRFVDVTRTGQVRNPKHEIRNKFKTKIQNHGWPLNAKPVQAPKSYFLGISVFGFWICFGFWISSLDSRTAVPTAVTIACHGQVSRARRTFEAGFAEELPATSKDKFAFRFQCAARV
jgi:hypothetical protein